jgi:hypothetical protein
VAGNCSDAATAAEVPDPTLNPGHSCSAWRNTSTRVVQVRVPWHVHLEVARPIPALEPIEIRVETLHVPAGWDQEPEVRKLADLLEQGGAPRTQALFLLPALRDTLSPIDLDVGVAGAGDVKIEGFKPQAPERGLAQAFRIWQQGAAAAGFTFSGVVPDSVKPGDVLVVRVTARHPETKVSAPRTVEYVEILHVRPKG